MGANQIQIGGDHYKGTSLQHWDIMAQNNIGYLEGHLTKYLRHRKKNGREDVRKMLHFLDKILECIDQFGYYASGRAPYSQLEHFCIEQGYNDHERFIMITICRWTTRDQVEECRFHIQALIDEYSVAT